jgi:glycosyltransferase involved in cell wall biosynthesis
MTPPGKPASGGRIIFDISSVSRWLGPPVGIIRREHELARHALARRPDIAFSFFDVASSSFRAVDPRWVERLAGWNHAIELGSADPKGRRLNPSRISLTLWLERWRLAARLPAARRAIDLAQRLLWLPGRLPARFTDKDNVRIGRVPVDLALGAPLELGPGDVIVSVGNDWVCKDAAAIAKLKKRHGFRFVAMCHDLMPIRYPALFPEGVAQQFRRHWTIMFACADRVLVNSRTVEHDIRGFCREAGIAEGETALVQPGCDLATPAVPAALPPGLEPGKFALFVGTIEPRKGHAMLIEVWRQLLAEGVPQGRGFKLEFAGNPGWDVDDVLRQIADPDNFAGTLLHVRGADDRVLWGLYRAAAFCVLPSLCEGFGVPIIEAFAHGKAVIASSGGALAETAGGLSPCLPARDHKTWHAMLRHWIEDDDARAPYEARIRDSFRHST